MSVFPQIYKAKLGYSENKTTVKKKKKPDKKKKNMAIVHQETKNTDPFQSGEIA